MTSRKAKQIIFGIFLFIFAAVAVRTFVVHSMFANYVFEEWRVNYSGGFVRRGLTGTFMIFLQDSYNINIYEALRSLSYLVYLLFASVCFLKINKSKGMLDLESLVIVLFLPSLIMFPLKDFKAIGRKDFFLFFGAIANLFLVQISARSLNLKENSNL
ncbi:hypothetical protein [Baaleninema sp.]|uniref:hypothetical protein n=1 Tax=Baaleninema sp. TaxID=3101197 RepID=UPI003CFF9852